MDPLTAFGLSANVVQLISFAFGLISKSREIYSSAKGCADQVETLDTVYGQLRHLSSSLEISSQRDAKLEAVGEVGEFVQHVFAINDLSSACKADCDRLLEIVRKLKCGNSSKTR